MAQFKIYGHRTFLEGAAKEISTAIHSASMGALGLPEAKRFHRFIALDQWQFISPPDRSGQYLIIEVVMFEGRPVSTIKAFYAQLLRNLDHDCGIAPNDIELTITESPRHNWLIRGQAGDELALDYLVGNDAGAES